MVTFDNRNDLAKQIKLDLTALDKPQVVIGVDGNDDAGKTCLARKLGSFLSAPVVSLDDFAIPNVKGAYIPFLRAGDVRQQLGAKHPVLIIEGVCLLAAARRCEFAVNILIYVKHMRRRGQWTDEGELNAIRDPEKRIEELTNELRSFVEDRARIPGSEPARSSAEVKLCELKQEIIRYHAEYKPIEKADYVFHRIESE
jgi:uridine kinase